jgi:aryl-alcohol dehydrogenase-like predicted oxidoreductase
MERRELAASGLVVSELCMGCMPFGARVSGADIDALLSRYRDAGGNFFDTAHCYSFWTPCGDGASERLLGDYVKRAGCRDEVVIGTKGGHPSAPNYRKVDRYLTAGRIAADIDDSLARLQVDVIDLYWLHRDDPRVDVGTVLDILNAEVRRGRIRAFGGSNWTSQRLDEANRYAAEHGIDGFAASQPQWSLLQYEPQSQAQRLEPGVLLHMDDEDRRRHASSRLPVVPYGPTGNGFFATNGERPERFRSEANAGRARRSAEFARKHGTSPNRVALAWLLHQPFPVVPILGTANVEHLEDALGCVDITLAEAEIDWLEHGE